MPSLSAGSSNIRCFVGAGRLSATEEKAKQIEQVALSELKRHSTKYLVGDSATELDHETLEQNLVASGFSRFHAVSPEILNTKGKFLMESWLGRWCAERSLPKESVTALIICDYMSAADLFSSFSLVSLSQDSHVIEPCFFWLEDGPQFAPKKNHPTKTHQDDFKNPIGKPFKVMKLSSEFFPPIGSMYGIYLPLFTHISTEITIGAGIFTLHIYLSMGLVYLPLFTIIYHLPTFHLIL